MRFKLVLAMLAVALLGTAATAEATAKLPFDLARAWSKQEVEQWCSEESQCDTWKVFTCHRFSRTRVDCGAAIVDHRDYRYCAAIVVNKVIANSEEADSWFRAERCGDIE
jgi:hypothetical protein